MCRFERLSKQSQDTIYNILENLYKSKEDIASWFNIEKVVSIRLPFDVKTEANRLIHFEILQEKGHLLRFCSPLHALWFDAKYKKRAIIHGGTIGQQISNKQFLLPSIPLNPSEDIKQKCESLKDLKSKLRKLLDETSQIFKNVENPDAWRDASTVVKTDNTWSIFIKALRDLFVEDMISRLVSWEGKEKFPDLNRELHSIRQRRNYIEHPILDMIEKKKRNVVTEILVKISYIV